MMLVVGGLGDNEASLFYCPVHYVHVYRLTFNNEIFGKTVLRYYWKLVTKNIYHKPNMITMINISRHQPNLFFLKYISRQILSNGNLNYQSIMSTIAPSIQADEKTHCLRRPF